MPPITQPFAVFTVLNFAALQQILGSTPGDMAFVQQNPDTSALNKYFVLVPTDTQTPNGSTIIAAASGGNWLVLTGGGGGGGNPPIRFALSAAGGASGTTLLSGTRIFSVMVTVSTIFAPVPGTTLELGTVSSPSFIFGTGTVDSALATLGPIVLNVDAVMPTNSSLQATMTGASSGAGSITILDYAPSTLP